MNARDWIEGRNKHNVHRECGYKCCYCGKQMHRGHLELTVDHIVPRAMLRGGVLPHNLVTACRECNQAKADTFQIPPMLPDYPFFAIALWVSFAKRVTGKGARPLVCR